MSKDFDVKKDLTMEDIEAMYRKKRDLEGKNSIQLAGKILAKRVTEPKQKMSADDKGNFTVPMFSEDGEPIMWEAKHFVSLAFEGGQIEISIPKEWDIQLNISDRVLFDGNKLANKKGVVSDNFYKYTLLN